MAIVKLGKYELHEQIGKGGFGIVYRATDTVLGRDVALKILHPQLTVDANFIERFQSEARKIATFNHPNIATVYELGEESGWIFIAMRYLPGGSLRDKLKKEGPLNFEQALQITKEISTGLKVAHAKGLIHRDIKPENILFTDEGQAVISDFGLAKVIQQSSSSSSSSSGSGGIGTPAYRAPELWRGKPPASPATDEYSLACVFTEMLSGRQLFSGDTPDEIITQHLVDGAVLPEKWPAKVPDGINVVLEKALDKDPAKRFQDVTSFVNALQGLQEAKPKPAPEVHWPAQYPEEKPVEPKDGSTARHPKRNPLIPGVIVIFLILGILVICAISFAGKSWLNSMVVSTPLPTNAVQTALAMPAETITPRPIPTDTFAPLPLQTETLAPEPTSLPISTIQAQVKASRAWPYEGPNMGYPQSNENGYPAGTSLTLIASDPTGQWFQVKAPDGTGGWLNIAWLDLPSDLSTLPVISVFPPIPTPQKSGKNNCPWWGCP